MVSLVGSDLADILRVTSGDDTISGLGGNDTLFGFGGADTIDGGDGDDVIQGGGGYTVYDAVKEFGKATIAYTGTVTSNIYRVELHRAGEITEFDGDTVSVWRIRSSATQDVTVMVKSINGLSTQTFVMPAKSEMYITSTQLANHQLFVNNTPIKQVMPPYTSTVFSQPTAYVGPADGNDILRGGAGNDIINGDDGNDLLDGGVGNDTLDGGVGNDTLIGGNGADVMNGGDGFDAADYRTSTAGVNVNLATLVVVGGDADGDTLISIEHVLGSASDDTIVGSDADERLSGEGGNDVLDGGLGNDQVVGGAGNDVLDGGLGNDQVAGGAGNDVLDGGDGIDKIEGGFGNDILAGGAGGDVISGGDGIDYVDYRKSTAGVTVDLVEQTASGGDAERDTLSGIENVLASAFDDVIIAGASGDRLSGRGGNDTLNGGAGIDTLIGGEGADLLIGGTGIDTASYAAATAGVGVDLILGGFAGEALGDSYRGIEFVLGSDFDDKISGDGFNNRLIGGAGSDFLGGGGGNDALIGGAGDDVQAGGNGYDVFWFRDADQGNDMIVDFWAGSRMTDRLWLGGASGVNNWAGVMNAAADTADGVVLTLANGTVLLAGVKVAMLAADDFLF